MRIAVPSLAFCFAAAIFAGLSVNGTGCGSQPAGLSGGTTGGLSTSTGSSSGGAGGAGMKVDPKPLFNAIQQDLITACASCHEPGGVADRPFLAPPDRYQSIISWPGVITKPSSNSILLTHPIAGTTHPGQNIDAPCAGLQGKVLQPEIKMWLDAEAAAIADPTDMAKPQIPPVAPIMGFNAIYLTPLDPNLEGVAITFNADTVGTTTLKLSDIEVHTTTKTGVHIVHPIFVVYPVGGTPDPDPVDSFDGFDTYFAQSTSTALGAGVLLLDNWASDAKLSIVFETVEPYSSSSGMGGAGGTTGTGGGCKDVTTFTMDAAPKFQANCFSCHGGANQMAMAAVDMSQLMANAGAACAQIKSRVNPTTPDQSVIYVTTDPNGNAAHPFKFGGSTSSFNTFKTSVSQWITKEQ